MNTYCSESLGLRDKYCLGLQDKDSRLGMYWIPRLAGTTLLQQFSTDSPPHALQPTQENFGSPAFKHAMAFCSALNALFSEAG